jgi:hypothetical protein
MRRSAQKMLGYDPYRSEGRLVEMTMMTILWVNREL